MEGFKTGGIRIPEAGELEVASSSYELEEAEISENRFAAKK